MEKEKLLIRGSDGYAHVNDIDSDYDVEEPPIPKKSASRFSEKDKKAQRALIYATCFTIVFMVAEIVGGYFAKSLAIMTDAAHLLTDVAAMLMSLFAMHLARRPADRYMTFGYHRAEILGALASIITIWALVGILIYEACMRLKNDARLLGEEVDGKIMTIIGSCGLAVNIIDALILNWGNAPHGHSHGHGGGHGHSHGHSHGGEKKEKKNKIKKVKSSEEGHGHSHAHKHGHGHGDEDDHDHEHEVKKEKKEKKEGHSHQHKHENEHEHKEKDPEKKKKKGGHGHSHGHGGHGSGGHSHGHGEEDTEANGELRSPIVKSKSDSKPAKSKSKIDDENVNVRAAFLHVVGDCIQSVGVIIASLIVWLGNYFTYHQIRVQKSFYNLADPIASLLFGVITLFTTLRLLKGIIDVLMERVPDGVDYEDILNSFQEIEGVSEVTDLHIWSISVGKVALSVHITSNRHTEVLIEAQQVCKSHGIHHATIQVNSARINSQLQCRGFESLEIEEDHHH